MYGVGQILGRENSGRRLTRLRPAALALAILLLMALPRPAPAEDNHHVFWAVKGQHNTVYFLGSVHMLKAADRELPPEIMRAYAQSKTLVMELNLSDVNADALLGAGLESATLPAGQSLAEVIGPDLYRVLLAHAEPLGLDPDMLAHFRPWFAALLLEQLSLAQAGFDASTGVDLQLTKRAEQDHKPIVALETVAEQLGIFASLSREQQREYLRSTLHELDTASTDTANLVQAWQHGDTAALARLLRAASADSPTLFRMLTTDRNRKWLPTITALLSDDHDDLVIVGALHLIGNDGLIELLKRAGYSAVQH